MIEILDWIGYAEQEVAYNNNYVIQTADYNYISKRLRAVEILEYYVNGALFSEESFDFNYDYSNNLESISMYYKESSYYIDSKLTFSQFSLFENNYNVDILSILGLYIGRDFASNIGRTGERSSYLPTRAYIYTNRNGSYREEVNYYISYVGNNGLITTIDISSTNGINKTLYLSYQ